MENVDESSPLELRLEGQNSAVLALPDPAAKRSEKGNNFLRYYFMNESDLRANFEKMVILRLGTTAHISFREEAEVIARKKAEEIAVKEWDKFIRDVKAGSELDAAPEDETLPSIVDKWDQLLTKVKTARDSAVKKKQEISAERWEHLLKEVEVGSVKAVLQDHEELATDHWL